MSHDYSQWSHAELIERVTVLEAQLRAQNDQARPADSRFAKIDTVSSPATPPVRPQTTSADDPTATLHPNKKLKGSEKSERRIDPSRYHTRLIALKFAYLGGKYHGYEHHRNNTTPLPTIEEELFKALWKTRLVFPRYRDGEHEGDVCWEGTEYSKCGRTDRGVSAFGQVVGVRVRSARPKPKVKTGPRVSKAEDGSEGQSQEQDADRTIGETPSEEEMQAELDKTWDSIRDELPYIQLLNRVLPPDIRVLAWCPDPPANFSARFNCKERRYRYFFTNPAYMPSSHVQGPGWLDIAAMREAAKKYEGLQDFQNLCKVDPSKQITDFKRRVFHADIHDVDPEHPEPTEDDVVGAVAAPKLYYFEVRGSAFLWHQVRHLVAILFLVGQGYEQPSIVDELLDTRKNANRPVYNMASDVPLVLWDCIFPEPSKVVGTDHGYIPGQPQTFHGYQDSLKWVYAGTSTGGRDSSKRVTPGIDDGMLGRSGLLTELWALWRERKINEVLAGGLLQLVSQGHASRQTQCAQQLTLAQARQLRDHSDRIFDGSESPPFVGTYVPLMQRQRVETPAVVNARYAARKGLSADSKGESDNDE